MKTLDSFLQKGDGVEITRNLGDFIEVLTGYPFMSESYTDGPDGYRIARGVNIKEGIFNWDNNVKFWPDLSLDLEKYLLKEGDILYPMDGSKLGKNFVQVRREDLPLLLIQRVARLRAKENILQDYLYSIISSEYFSRYIDLIRTGTSIPHISANQIKEYPAKIHLIKQQKAIINVLKTLRDKIYLNTQINSTLESLARALFHSWFIRFDPFQDREFVDSELGQIPIGWKVISHEDLGNIYGGGTPSTKTEEYWNGDICFLTPSDVTSLQSPFMFNTGRKITQLGLHNCSSKLHPINSVFMTSRATIGEVCINDIETATNQGFIVVRPKKEEFLYFIAIFLKLNSENYISVAGGSTFREINRSTFKSLKLIFPNEEVLLQFHSLVHPLYERIRSNSQEILILSSLRDLLLPQLLSGKLRIKDPERFLEELEK